MEPEEGRVLRSRSRRQRHRYRSRTPAPVGDHSSAESSDSDSTEGPERRNLSPVEVLRRVASIRRASSRPRPRGRPRGRGTSRGRRVQRNEQNRPDDEEVMEGDVDEPGADEPVAGPSRRPPNQRRRRGTNSPRPGPSRRPDSLETARIRLGMPQGIRPVVAVSSGSSIDEAAVDIGEAAMEQPSGDARLMPYILFPHPDFIQNRTMASVSYHIANLLEKMQSADKDFRFMATNDLMAELQKDSIKLDDDSERKVVRMLLRLLEDKNGEVQNLAVKCLGPLVNKVKEYQVESIVESLCANMVSDKEQLRDISSIGLKTVIAELPSSPGGLSGNICKRITGRLTTAIERDDVSVQLEALDIISDLLFRFGSSLNSYHSAILNALLPQLVSQRQAIRKRSILACSNLVISCNISLYNRLIDHLYQGIQPDLNNPSQIRTCIQCLASVCRQSGQRFGEHIAKFVPIIIVWIGMDDDETREFCLQAFEAFVSRCPKEISSNINTITEMCMTYMTHDPNYNYDEDGDDRAMADDEEEDDGTEEYSDDDDMSWKVRRAAAKCLETIISTRHELLADFYRSLAPVLISRFKEREENVKSDIFRAYLALLKQTRPTTTANLDPNSMEQEELPIYLLQIQIPTLVRSVCSQMKEKSVKTRQDCFTLLKELCNVLPGALTHEMGELIPGILYSLSERNASSNMKIDALCFIYCLSTTHPPEVFHPYIHILLPPIIQAIGDSFYKITAEGLHVLQEMVRVIRPLNGATNFDYLPYVGEIYTCTFGKLQASDIDQEVKEKAISTMGQVLANLGDHLGSELQRCLPLFLDRLRNEITRLTTVKALTKIAASPLGIDLPILDEAIPVLGLFLRKNQRALKLSTLLLLDTFIKNYNRYLYVDLLQHVIIELPPLLDEGDLHIAQFTLFILKSIAEHQPLALADITSNNIFAQIITLVRSPLLQGSCLVALLDFLKVLVSCNLPTLQYNDLLTYLIQPITTAQETNTEANVHRTAYYSLAKCVATVTTTMPENVMTIVSKFINDFQNARTDSLKIFSLLVIGEIGRNTDLTAFPVLDQTVSQAFCVVSEEVKSAASYALGSIAIGNLQQYLPYILAENVDEPRRQYLLLHSLKEVIVCLSTTPEGVAQLKPFIPQIWRTLFRYCDSEEEGTRNVVSECLGKLTLIDPVILLPKLKEGLCSQSPLMRTTIVTAVKFTISDQPSSIDSLLRLCIGDFLMTIEDPDLNVRRVALVAFNSAAHNKPSLIRDLLDQILPRLYHETMVKRDLIREVEMGPFKHTVDDGLDLRKTAFECMYTLLDSCLDRLNIFEFINHVELGLKDHYDIKMLTYLMVIRLSEIVPGAILQNIDRLIEHLKATVFSKVKANSVKQEYEKQDELKKGALRAIAALAKMADADKNQHLNEFLSHIKTTPDLCLIFDSIQKDSSTSVNDFFLMDQS